MATVREWVEGARLRTLPASISPVVAGTGFAWFVQGALGSPAFSLPGLIGRALLCLVVALAVQIGCNLANDYSDGIRGSDADRVGPQRLVGSGAATPRAVKTAAFACFGLSCLAGLVLTAMTGRWWLIAVGAACVLAAWFYTGGPRPYGYAGLGEVFVFVFFGLIGTLGTVYVQSGTGSAPGQAPLLWWPALLVAVALGLLTIAILVANNLRDIAGDAANGKRTLAVRLGSRATRRFYVALVVATAVVLGLLACLRRGDGVSLWPSLAGLAGVAVLVPACRHVLRGAVGHDLVVVLKRTGIAELITAFALVAGWLLLWINN